MTEEKIVKMMILTMADVAEWLKNCTLVLLIADKVAMRIERYFEHKRCLFMNIDHVKLLLLSLCRQTGSVFELLFKIAISLLVVCLLLIEIVVILPDIEGVIHCFLFDVFLRSWSLGYVRSWKIKWCGI